MPPRKSLKVQIFPSYFKALRITGKSLWSLKVLEITLVGLECTGILVFAVKAFRTLDYLK